MYFCASNNAEQSKNCKLQGRANIKTIVTGQECTAAEEKQNKQNKPLPAKGQDSIEKETVSKKWQDK